VGDPANLNGELSNILNFISASAGLGTAAMGLVDATKAFAGGPSNFGFPCIREALTPFLTDPTPPDTAVFSRAGILETLHAAWINGVTATDQKAKAKALIHLRLNSATAPAMAREAGVNATALAGLATAIAAGNPPTPQQIVVLGQFDVVLSARLDAAYERGNQIYRNACKLLSLLFSVILGVIGGSLVFGGDSYWLVSWNFWLSFIVGLSAAPLAPVAKDLASSLQAAVAAVGTVKR
jgi:hypothetical protein